jgi:hypothetical protein
LKQTEADIGNWLRHKTQEFFSGMKNGSKETGIGLVILSDESGLLVITKSLYATGGLLQLVKKNCNGRSFIKATNRLSSFKTNFITGL